MADSELKVAKRSQRTASEELRRASERKVSEGLIQLLPGAYKLVRESFLLLDSDATGDVSRENIKNMLVTLGIRNNSATLDSMLERSGDPVNFASYMAIMSELFHDLPEEADLKQMFDCFRRKDGSLDSQELTTALKTQGLTSEEIDKVFEQYSKMTANGKLFDTKAFISTMSI